jgi:hypothetical protein
MQRLLLIIGLLAIGGCATDEAALSEGSQDAPRIIQETRLPLRTERAGAQAAERRWTFTGPSIQGSVDGSGAWSLRAEIDHPRLRCATYEAGVRVGRGDASCDNVEWLTAPQFGPERLQCNQATTVHAGNGRFDLPQSALGGINCVGVVVRCRGGGC